MSKNCLLIQRLFNCDFGFLAKLGIVVVVLASVWPLSGMAAVTSGYDRGFFIQSEDERFRFKVTGYVQGLASATTIESDADTTDIRVRRARFKLGGHAFDKRFVYLVEYEFNGGRIFSSYAQYVHSPGFTFRIGQYRVAFNSEGATSNSTLQFVDRSLAHVFFGIRNEREPGFGFLGTLFSKKLEYSAGVYTGDGFGNRNDNPDVRLAARLLINLLGQHGNKYGDYSFSQTPQVALGFGGMRNNTVDGKSFDATTDLSLKYLGVGAQASYFFRSSNVGSATYDSDHGVMALLGYMVSNSVELAGRAAHIFVGDGNNLGEYTSAINWYIFGHHMVKLAVDYSLLTVQNNDVNGGDQLSHRGRAQFQIKF